MIAYVYILVALVVSNEMLCKKLTTSNSMKKQLIHSLTNDFQSYAQHTVNGIEFWLARDLQIFLGYAKWDNFQQVLSKAKTACEVSGQNISDHFADVGKTIQMPKGATKEIPDTMLTRFACYLLAQNGDPRKQQIAFAQSYFAVQTRNAELIEARMLENERIQSREKLKQTESELSDTISELTGGGKNFALIRSKGDHALFGKSTKEMKETWKVPQKRPLADFAPTIILKAKDFAAEITIHNARTHTMSSEEAIAHEHVTNNSAIRETLISRGITPEKLSPAEDAEKVKRRLISADRKSLNKPDSLEND